MNDVERGGTLGECSKTEKRVIEQTPSKSVSMSARRYRQIMDCVERGLLCCAAGCRIKIMT